MLSATATPPTMPTTAMLLAAGLGTRLRPLTLTTPKPLLPLQGRPLLEWWLRLLAAAGIQRVVVNVSYLRAALIDYLEQQTIIPVQISIEPEPLETGGGVKQALPWLGDAPFFVINPDVVFAASPTLNPLQELAAAWQPTQHDILLLTAPLAGARGFARGDFAYAPAPHLQRGANVRADQVYLGVQLLKPSCYAPYAPGVFSNNLLFDAAMGQGRLHGLTTACDFYHVGTLEDYQAAATSFCPAP